MPDEQQIIRRRPGSATGAAFTVRLPAKLNRALTADAARRGVSKAALVEEFIREGLERGAGTMTATRWQDLEVYGEDGKERLGTLGEVVSGPYAADDLRYAEVRGGELAGWQQHFVAAPGEAPEWDTPRGPVDWAGFEDALARAGIAR